MKKNGVESVMDDPMAFRTQVRMASVQVSGLSRGEIEMALAYEVEPVSLIPASEAEVDFKQVEGDDPSVAVYNVAVRKRIGKKAISGKRHIKVLSVIGVLILAFIAADAIILNRSLASLKSERLVRSRLDAKIKAARREESALRAETERLKAARAAAIAAQERVSSLRGAWLKVLGALASSCDGKAVVTALESKVPFKFKINATAVSASAATDVMASFSRSAAKEGWRVSPGSTVSGAEEAMAKFDCEVTHD